MHYRNWNRRQYTVPSPETFGNNTPIDENIETTNEGKILLWLAYW